MNKGVYTSYNQDGFIYQSYILCTSLAQARELIDVRNLDEKIESSITDIAVIPDYKDLSDGEFIDKLPDILHLASYLSYIALSAKTMSVQEVLGDHGIIHELTHLNNNVVAPDASASNNVKKIREMFYQLQKKAIGIFP